jgi:hypothetical protein
LEARISLAIACNSCGHEEAVRLVYEHLECPMSKVFMEGWKITDKDKNYMSEYHSKPEAKTRRVQVARKKMKQTRIEESEAQRKGQYYQSGIGVFTDEDFLFGREEPNEALAPDLLENEPVLPFASAIVNLEKETFPEFQIKKCGKCGGTDHLRSSSKKCPLHKKA